METQSEASSAVHSERPRAPGTDARVADLSSRARSDTPLEQACDRLCRLAARLVDAPAAVVTLRDEDRPFLVGAEGLADPLSWGISPLSITLSEHTGAHGEPLSVEDMGPHELLSEDPLARAEGFRAFLVLPIRVADEALGTLCVLSRTPRSWTEQDVEALTEVAACVVTEIRLRGSLRQIRSVEQASGAKERQRFLELIDALDVIVKERHLDSGRFTFVSRRAEDLLGYPVGRWLEDPDFWRDTFVHPEDRARAQLAIELASRQRTPLAVEYRALTADGQVRWIRDLARPLGDADDRLLRGVLVDVTAQKATQQRLERTVAALRLLEELALIANESDSIQDPFERAVRRLCEHTGWPVGHAYFRSESDPEELIPSAIWFLGDPERYQPFQETTEQIRFRAGEGLPGLVLRSRRAEWISRISEGLESGRQGAAKKAGLNSVFAFPVGSGKEVAAVLEFFSPAETDPDAEMVELAEHVGAILGPILERKRAEQVLRESELRTRRIVETANEAFISIDEAGLIREWNAEAERTFGWSREEALGRELAALLVPERYRDLHRTALGNFLETGEGQLLGKRVELEAVTRSGGEIPVEFSIAPVREKGRWVFNAFLRDISRRKWDERELVKRERGLVYAQRLAHVGSWEWHIGNDEVTGSDELYRIFQAEANGLQGGLEAYLERIAPEDRDLAEAVVRGALETGEEFMLEHRIVRPDGSLRVVLAQGSVEKDAEGHPERLIGTVQDITEQKELRERDRELAAEQAARTEAEAAEGRIRSILEGITDAFLHVDREWRLTYVNAEAERLLQREAPELIGARLWDVFEVAGASSFRSRFEDALARDRPVEFEEYHPPLGAWFDVRAYPSESGLSLYFHDVTARKKADTERDEALQDLERVTHLLSSERTTLEEQARELRKTALALQRSNRELDQFAYVASHDLKAPLRGIANLTHWLSEDLQGRLDVQAHRYLELMRGRVSRMEKLIDGILQYSRAGRTRDDPEPVDVGQLVREVVDMLDPPDRFSIDVGGYMPVLVTERTPLQQVFLNLVGNALKHADGEEPQVKISVTDEGGGWYEFSVSDHGPGIPADYHEKIFAMFQTLKAKDELESTGIGLSVVKRIVEHQGGQVWVESESGRGACFRFLWPDTPGQGKEGGPWRTTR